VQFHRTIQPQLLRNPEQGRKSGHLGYFFGYFSVTCRPISSIETANDAIPARILTGVAQTRRLSASPVER
jgi:hypothetical protein